MKVVLFFLVLSVSAHAGIGSLLDLEAPPDSTEAFRLGRACGGKTESRAMRAILIPKLGETAQVEITLLSDDPGGPELRIRSPKLLAHLKGKKSRVLSVIFRREGKGFIDKNAVVELKPCLIDGRTVDYWLEKDASKVTK